MAIPCPTCQLRITGIEPISSAWKADGLPLIYIRLSFVPGVPNRPIIGAGLAFHAQRLCPAQAPSRMRVMDHSCSIHFIYDNSWNAIASRSYLSDSRAIEPNLWRSHRELQGRSSRKQSHHSTRETIHQHGNRFLRGLAFRGNSGEGAARLWRSCPGWIDGGTPGR